MLPARSVGNKNLKFRGDITSFKAHKGKRVRDEYVCIVEKRQQKLFSTEFYIVQISNSASSLKHKIYKMNNIHTYIKMFTNCSDEMENVFH